MRHRKRSAGVKVRSSSSVRRGFTLVELLVALVLLDIGLLALVGLTTSMTQSIDRLRASARAESIATARVERIAATPCTSSTTGIEHPSAGVTEWFSDQPAPNDTRLVVDSVTVTISRGARTAVVRTRARC
jgi:type II secretion system protein I